jgi:hypothetical protein
LGFVGKEPAQAALTTDDITDGAIVNADINASAAIAMSKTAFSAGTGITLSTNTLNVDAAQTGITSLLATDIKIGEDDQTKIDFEDANKINFYANNAKEVELAENSLSPGTSDGTALGTTSLMWSDLFLADGGVINLNNGDVLLTHSANTLTLTGGGLVVGVDDTGHDVKFFGATSGKYMEWDESADQLDVTGSFDVTGNSTMVGTLTVGVNDTGHDVKFFGATSGKYMEWDESADQLDVTGSLDVTGNTSMVGTLTIGVNDTGHDVKFFGASAGAYMEWDESADQLRIMGASADATTSTGKLLLATSLTDINANDVIGKIEFQAPHEAGGTDAIEVAAGIEAVAQGTFSSSVNSTDLVFKTGHSEAATEKFRFTSQGEIGIGGTNYGTDGQVLTSGGAGAAPSWATASSGGTTSLVADGSISAGDRVAITSAGKAKTIAALQTGVNNTTLTNIVGFGGNEYMRSAADPDNNKILTVFRDGDNSNRGTAIVVDVDSNGDFSVGSEAIFESDATAYCNLVYDENVNKFGIFWRDNSGPYSYGGVATISGTSVSFGTKNSSFFQSYGTINHNTTGFAAYFDPDENKIALFVHDAENTAVYATVGTISGTDISFTDEVLVSSDASTYTGNGYGMMACYDTAANRGVLVWGDAGDNNKLTSVVTTISSGDISIGTEVHVTETATATSSNLYPAICFDSTSEKVIYMCYNSSTGDGEVYVGTVTGSSTNTCSWGSATVMTDGDGSYDNALVDAGGGNIVFAHEDRTKSNNVDLVQVGVLTVSGTSAVVKHRQKLYSTYVDTMNLVKGGAGNKIVALSEVGSAIFGAAPDLPDNAGAFIGIANSAISDTATGTIQLHGTIATNQSSLSTGSLYYLTSAGALTTTATGFAKIGHALSSTTLLIQGTLPDTT